uniref:Uncharacterized protein n=1 Tax=Knipowitschia caucasica TaxID=637954 RepID=A0AAV2MR23_KNICA
MGYRPRPVHFVHVQSNLVTGKFPLAVVPALPIENVDMILCNDLAGGMVFPPLLDAVLSPLVCASDRQMPTGCAVAHTRPPEQCGCSLPASQVKPRVPPHFTPPATSVRKHKARATRLRSGERHCQHHGKRFGSRSASFSSRP